MSALERLEELRAAVRAAEANVAAADDEMRRDAGAIDRARAAVSSHQEAVAAGERPADPEREADLGEALRAAEAAVSWRLDGGRYVPFNPVLEANLAGARRAFERRRDELRRFENAEGLAVAAELAARARDLRDRYEPVRRQVAALEREWAALAAEWRPVLARLGIAAEALPGSPVKTNIVRPTELMVPPSLLVESQAEMGALPTSKAAQLLDEETAGR